jgi:hypothetical protein
MNATKSPPSDAKPPIFESAALAWSDTGRTVRALPVPALIALVVVTALTIGQDLLIPQQQQQQSARFVPVLTAFLVAGVQACLITPYLIALHRFIILGEGTSGYPLAPATPRFQRYFGWSLAVSVLGLLPTALPLIVTADPIVRLALFAVLVVGFVVVSVRMLILFPATAVEAPNASFANAWADSAGTFWRTIGILVLALIPWIALIAVSAVVGVLTGAISETPLPLGSLMIVSSAVQAVIVLLGCTLAFAIASRLYQRIGERLRPAPAPAPSKAKRERYRQRR